jgi:enoyl-CoA hydratase
MSENVRPTERWTGIGYSADDGIAEIVIGREGQVFMTDAVLDELTEATQMAVNDVAVRVILYRGGAPGTFVQHHDIAELAVFARNLQQRRGAFSDPGGPADVMSADHAYAAIASSPKPTIAALNGNCMAGGLELALCCDMRIAQTGSYVGLVEAQFDCLPGGGGLPRLVRLLGYDQAIPLLLFGTALAAEDAVAAGLAHALAKDALDLARSWAARLASRSPLALRHIKALAREAVVMPVELSLARSRRRLFDLWSREEAMSRIDAFQRGEWEIALGSPESAA